MKTQLHDRNTARPLGGSAVIRESLGSVLPGSAILPVAGGRLRPRQSCAAFRLC